MKHSALLLASILFTVTSPVAHQITESQIDGIEPPALKVKMCDLYQDPQQFAGKLVEFRAAVMGRRLDDLWIEDFDGPTCDSYMRIIAMFPEQITPKPPFRFVGSESFREFTSSIRGMRVDATFVGRFDPGFVWRQKKRTQIAEVPGFRDKEKEYDGRIVVQSILEIVARRIPRL